MSEEKELEQLTKIDPKVIQTMLLFKMYKTLRKIENKEDKLSAFITFMGPMTRRFKREEQYQYATIPAGHSGRVYYLPNPQPDLLVGVITQVGNNYYPNTHLEWIIDYHPERIEYVIGEVHNPKEYERGIPFTHEVEWKAYNDDVSSHVFQVLCDGYFLNKKLYNKIVGE